MQNSYQTAASGVARLAASDTILQKRLKMLPKRIVLQHDARDLYPQATMRLITENQNGAEVSVGDVEHLVASQLHGLLGRQQHMRLAETSGQLLLDQTSEEAVRTMSHELAHGIACHGVEDSSWATTHPNSGKSLQASSIWSFLTKQRRM